MGYKGSIRPGYERGALTLSQLLKALESDPADLSHFGDGFTHSEARVSV